MCGVHRFVIPLATYSALISNQRSSRKGNLSRMEHAPIVMQTLWRARGTYFWSLFRKNPDIRAFYEPLHEGLADKTSIEFELELKRGHARELRHPKIDCHYFSEHPFQVAGGVALFDREMSFGNFILDETDEDRALEAYLHSLIEYAAEHGQRAFFKFCRGGLRAGFLKRSLGGTHIYVNRPPSEIHGSFRSFGDRSYFLSVLMHIALRHVDRPFFGTAMEILRSEGPIDDSYVVTRHDSDMAAAQAISAGLNECQSAILIGAFWSAYLLEGLAVADIVIDTERLGCDATYRRSVEEDLAQHLGPNALAEYRASPCLDDFTTYAGAIKEALNADERLRALAAALPPSARDSLGDCSRRLLDAIA